MKKLFFFLLSILFPVTVFAATFQYTDNTTSVSISGQTSSTTATITVNGRRSTQEPLPVRLLGLRVWNNQELSGAPVYEKTNTAGAQRTPEDSLQNHLVQNLTPDTTYYFKYYYGTSIPVMGTTYTPIASTQTYQFRTEKGDNPTTQPYDIQAIDSSGGVVKVTIKAPTGENASLGILVRTDANGGSPGNTPNSLNPGFVKYISVGRIPSGLNGVLPYEISELSPNTTYYFSLIKELAGQNTVVAKTSSATTGQKRLFIEALQDFEKNAELYILKGHIDTLKHPTTYKSFSIELQTSPTGPFSENENQTHPDAKTTLPSQASDLNADGGIADNGDYYFFLPRLEKGRTYYFRQIARGEGVVDIQLGKVNSERGISLQNSTGGIDDLEKRSYRLLAPFPGLSVLLDPDLCRERVLEGTARTGEICDVNDFLNFIFRIMIGLSAVLLVLRLIFEGYQYAVTDVPFLKVGAKQKIVEAFVGLLLALSAFLILNTINPKLVQNDIVIKGIALDALDFEEDSEPLLDDSQVKISPGKPLACPEGVVKVEGTVFYACKTIAGNIKRLVEDAKKAGFSLTGGGYRTAEAQIAVRKANCGTSNYDIYEKPSGKCRPPTARPGRSAHESGLAFDFKCNGKLIYWDNNPKNRKFGNKPETKACFDWLKANAAKYGLKNLHSENWHWSVNGR